MIGGPHDGVTYPSTFEPIPAPRRLSTMTTPPAAVLRDMDQTDDSGPHTHEVAAVLWDMDGTLVDTERYWMDAESELVTRCGGSWNHEDALTLIGAGLSYAATLFQSRGVSLSTEQIVTELSSRVEERLRTEGPPWRPGALELLHELSEASVPTALVTMSLRSTTNAVMAAIPFPAFTVSVTGDEVTRPKPDPEPYLHAARLLGVDIRRCVAIEDSPTGLAAAAASGAVAIGVPNYVPLDSDVATVLLPTLAHVHLSDLSALVADQRR